MHNYLNLMILGYTRSRGEAGDIEPGPCCGVQKQGKEQITVQRKVCNALLVKIYCLIKCVKGVCKRTKLIQLQESSILFF